MRGGLDDALERLARRDELRRRVAGQAAGTPPAVAELVEAVAAVVARNPELAITMGVEGAGDPVLLTFALDDGIVQVSADNPLTMQVPDAAAAAPRHADFDLDLEPVDDLGPAGTYAAAYQTPRPAPSTYAAPPPQTRPQTRPQTPSPTRATYTGTASLADQADPPSVLRPAPMPTPMPLWAEPEVTEMAAKRLAAMLRADPSLLERNAHD